MRDYEKYDERIKERIQRRMERHNGQGHVWTGLFLLLIGGLALARSVGAPVPVWLFSWQMLVIAIGLFIGIRKGFTDGGWFVPVLVGGAFLVNEYFLDGQLHKHLWPLILIIVGMFFIFRAGRGKPKWHQPWDEKKTTGAETLPVTTTSEESYGQDDVISVTSIFGGTEKMILSKNFKGGNMVNIFGGSEINLTQADINGTAVLDVTCIFGGATLIVPSHWVVKSDAVTIFGGIGDKRKNTANYTNEGAPKALVIKGTILFGGLEIKSF